MRKRGKDVPVIARWNGAVIANSDDTVVVEGNHYFPPSDVDQSKLLPSDTSTHCPWKGDASYYSIEVDGDTNTDAAWFYPAPKEAAQHIKDRIAFWKGIEVSAE